MIRKTRVLLVAFFLLFTLSGCATMYGLLGINEDPETGVVSGDSPDGSRSSGGLAAVLAGIFGMGNAVQGIANLVLNAKRKKWAQVGQSMASGINNVYRQREVIKDANGVERIVIAADALFTEQQKAQSKKGVRSHAAELVKQVESVEGDPDAETHPTDSSAAA